MFFACIFGEYNPSQPRISRLARSLEKLGPVKFVVSSGRGANVVAVGGKSKLSYLLRAARFLRRNAGKGDVVVGYVHAAGMAAWLGTRFTGAKFVYDYPDPWSGWYYYKSPRDSLKWKLGRAAFHWAEKTMYRGADFVLTASRSQLDFLERKHGRKKNSAVILNCPDIHAFKRKPSSALRKKLGLEGKTAFFFLGNIAEEYGADECVQAMEKLAVKHPEAVLCFLGKTKSKDAGFADRLKQEVAEKGLEKSVRFLGMVPYERVPDYLSLGEAGMVTYKDFFYNHLGGPNKLFEYMACGLIPVASRMKEFAYYLKDGANAFLYEPDDIEGLAQAMERVLLEKRKVILMRKRNLALVQNEFNWRVQEKKFLDAVRSIQ